MELQEMLSVLDNAIEGRPNSTLSEHSRALQRVRDSLASGPHVVADAPSAPPPRLDHYYVEVTLGDTVLAANEDEAWEMIMDKISTRKGMSLVGHTVQNDGPDS